MDEEEEEERGPSFRESLEAILLWNMACESSRLSTSADVSPC